MVQAKPERSYTQVARAASTAATREAIVAAAQFLFVEESNFDPTLAEIAARAGVSARTVLRHFGSKDGVIEAATADACARVAESRAAPPGDVRTAVRKLVDHYEEVGDWMLRLLAEAERQPTVQRVVEAGEQVHERWVAEAFAPALAGLGADARAARAGLLEAVTDLQVWALLRRRHGFGRPAAEAAMTSLIETAERYEGKQR